MQLTDSFTTTPARARPCIRRLGNRTAATRSFSGLAQITSAGARTLRKALAAYPSYEAESWIGALAPSPAGGRPSRLARTP